MSPMPLSPDRGFETLAEQKNAPTSEGAPPPGVVGTDLPQGASPGVLAASHVAHRKILTLKKHREPRHASAPR